MPSTNDGSFEEAASQEPVTQRLTIFAIDEHTRPVAWCVNGHIVEWLREFENLKTLASSAACVNEETGEWTSICVVCGEGIYRREELAEAA